MMCRTSDETDVTKGAQTRQLNARNCCSIIGENMGTELLGKGGWAEHALQNTYEILSKKTRTKDKTWKKLT
jgi:hypothetical protein